MWKDIINNCFTHLWELFVLTIPILISLYLTWYPLSNVDNISSRIYITIIIVLFLIVAIVVKLLITTINIVNQKQILLPRLRTVQNNRLVFDPSEIFSSQAVVSIYYKDEIEQYIGNGWIESVISGTKYLQVIVDDYVENWDKTKVLQNKGKIILKPSLPKYVSESTGD